MLALVAAASAASIGPGLLIPSATFEGAGVGSAGAFAAIGVPPAFHFGGVRASVGASTRLTVEVLAGAAPVGGVAWVGARYAAVHGEGFTLAPWLVGGVGWTLAGVTPGAVAGVALEGGGARVRLDLSVPLVLVAGSLDPPFAPLLPAVASTAGVSVRLGARHIVRLGIEPLGSPTASWAFVADRWYLRVHAGAAMLAAVPAGSVEAGVRW